MRHFSPLFVTIPGREGPLRKKNGCNLRGIRRSRYIKTSPLDFLWPLGGAARHVVNTMTWQKFVSSPISPVSENAERCNPPRRTPLPPPDRFPFIHFVWGADGGLFTHRETQFLFLGGCVCLCVCVTTCQIQFEYSLFMCSRYLLLVLVFVFWRRIIIFCDVDAE